MRYFAAWLIFGSAIIAFVSWGAADAGLLVHHGPEKEVVYGAEAFWYMAWRLGLVYIGITALAGVIMALTYPVSSRG